MDIFSTKKELQQHLQSIKQNGKTIGLVPTMGALHEGHLSLLKAAKQQCDVTVCTIFVNPTQFTNAADLTNYPRPVEQDTQKLISAGCDILFAPATTEMYGANEQWHIDLGELEHLLEGKYRPGHYQGVTQIVYKLFDLVKPQRAFFGQKDYQQFLIISKMVQLLHLPVKLVMCPIKRDENGLALSSRNVHLSDAEKEHALVLSRALKYVIEHIGKDGIAAVKNAMQLIMAEPSVELDYFEAADGDTLQPATKDTRHLIILTAAKVGNTRLIDNMIIR